MKKTFLLLSLCALLAACDSGYKKDGPDQVRAEQEAASAGAPELEADSATGANMAAVAHQPQMDTSITKIGTDNPGGLVAPGAKLIAGSTCLGCHKEKEKLVGPAYVAVAQKYPATEANIAMLASTIIKGGKGHWGEIPMTPHPQLSVADAREMVSYILTLK
ncbi:c-type cytochrome [Hymenobacter sp.]|uniref:c-type cytochrome n=1 Tax=Hymenobacter sp. TaxID=1898978 RepID=UPI00286B1E58|nr:c-type cytochrome [Hymenobacter sp.]